MHITRRQALTLSASALALSPRLAQADEAALYAAAKAEKEVVWYTTLIVNQAVRPIIEAFQTKYPGITVRYNRADSVPTAIKIIDESRAGAPQADVFDGIETEPPVAAAGFVAPYVSAHAGLYPPALRDANGMWLATNLYFLTPGYNTTLVKPAEVPKTLDDLLDPRWKGKIVWSNARSAGGPIFVGSVLRHLGEDKGMAWLEKFSRQQVVNAYITARAVLDQVIAGEYPLALAIFNHHAVLSAQKGAPVDWIKLNPIAAPMQVTSLVKNCAHPNAGKLLIDFIVSEEGQKIFADAGELPVHPNVKIKDPTMIPDGDTFKGSFLTPEELDASLLPWSKLFDEYFR